MLTPAFFRAKFEQGLPYEKYVAGARPDQRMNWERHHAAVRLTDAQRALLDGFTRRMNVLVTSGLWCGDCAVQVPMLAHIAGANPVIQLRMLDRDEHADLSDQIRICGGLRVPTAVFLNEDFEFMSILGDKTLTRLRSQGARLGMGAFCELPGASAPTDMVGGTVADWLQEFERVQLMLRLSPKLRDRHGD
ncbi:MAG TPA: thioredoxin family protein [Phycisphaerales bacterium]|nr:thioredoxin family protein [Phycisphaerales bacterium]